MNTFDKLDWAYLLTKIWKEDLGAPQSTKSIGVVQFNLTGK